MARTAGRSNPRISPGDDSYFILSGRTVTDLRRPCSAHSLGTKGSQSNCVITFAALGDYTRQSIIADFLSPKRVLQRISREYLASHGFGNI